ncbi:MAG TPA: methyltransferase domain-containing protein [Candidatus Limnocylindrales bacterium]|nr:methyltransferase domain-containing protein [Candidatus Limnocylindrales bacterium]
MTDQEARYDRIADGYAEWWSPVHRPGTMALLDEVSSDVAAGASRLLDVGCGTGAMAMDAVARWDSVVVDGVDVSAGMLRIAYAAASTLPPPASDRLRFTQAPADRLPFADGVFDVALSAFVLQLVPSRFRALREMRRVLRPGGRVAYVTWLRGGEPFGGDDAYDEARRDVGLEPRWGYEDDDDRDDPEPGDADDADPSNDDVPSPHAAVAQLRRAGFSAVRARPSVLEHAFTPEGYLGFLTRFDDEDEFATLEPAQRGALEHRLLDRLHALPRDRLVMRMPIVYATGVRTR